MADHCDLADASADDLFEAAATTEQGGINFNERMRSGHANLHVTKKLEFLRDDCLWSGAGEKPVSFYRILLPSVDDDKRADLRRILAEEQRHLQRLQLLRACSPLDFIAPQG